MIYQFNHIKLDNDQIDTGADFVLLPVVAMQSNPTKA